MVANRRVHACEGRRRQVEQAQVQPLAQAKHCKRTRACAGLPCRAGCPTGSTGLPKPPARPPTWQAGARAAVAPRHNTQLQVAGGLAGGGGQDERAAGKGSQVGLWLL